MTHSAGESIILDRDLVSQDHLPIIHAVVLAVQDEAQLLQVAAQLEQANIKFKLIVEPDLDGQATCLGICPLQDRSILKSITGKLKLLK